MIRLDSFSAVHYRGIDGLHLPHLTKANLITGANGVGKTALLEAMWLFNGRYRPSLLWNANVQRSHLPPTDPIARLTKGALELHGVENGTCHRLKSEFERIDDTTAEERNTVSIGDANSLPPVIGRICTYLDDALVNEGPEGVRMTPAGLVLYRSKKSPKGRPGSVIESIRFQQETSAEYLRRYSSLVQEGHKMEIMKAFGLITESMEDIGILTEDNGETFLSVTAAGGKPLPLHDLGGGAVRLFRLLLGFYSARDGILLTDELENGLHHNLHQKIWERSRNWMSRWNVQFVATTHSGELIDAAIDAFRDVPEDLSIHKLFRNEQTGRTDVATFSGEALDGVRYLNLEVR